MAVFVSWGELPFHPPLSPRFTLDFSVRIPKRNYEGGSRNFVTLLVTRLIAEWWGKMDSEGGRFGRSLLKCERIAARGWRRAGTTENYSAADMRHASQR